ncbi:uncharacterized protein FA14DRAFT_171446 [Meira miltonrushii]|uniref:Uncharacterized protein n=1 Tax=Meira miltonrushii TaxID=1280837 RepID=A0A316VAQ6_9BASI|nr:uncharacterized protein FA14DRAFT_171446 [Meira miltonrushii]PWN34687.1 hypothetical protein FA14DRAFT_171446 [Meira miltonrushii]
MSSSQRPGDDPSNPHQDLRIPSQFPSYYLGQSLPSTSLHLQTLSAPPIAAQIASLHRAAEVARFEWRSSQQTTITELVVIGARLRNLNVEEEAATAVARLHRLNEEGVAIAAARSYHLLPQSLINARTEQTPQRAPSERIFSSSLDAYLSAARDLSQPNEQPADVADLFDAYLSEDYDSDATEDEVLASTLRPTQERRRQSNDRRTDGLSPERRRFSQSVSHLTNEYAAESQVWDRMVEDLAIGAGVGGRGRNTAGGLGTNAHNRGISGGIAASMLALSAAIPRPDVMGPAGTASNSARLLPHPIWARRYPGAAGEWLRGELARRANSRTSTNQNGTNTTAVPTSEETRRARNTALRTGGTSSRRDSPSTTRRTSPSVSRRPPPPDFDAPSENQTTDAFDDIFSNPRTRDRASTRLPIAPPPASSTSPWNALQIPSLDPSNRASVRSNLSTGSAAIGTGAPQNEQNEGALTVPSNAAALAPTPPPGLAREGGNADSTANVNQAPTPRSEAAERVARMAQRMRERNAQNQSEPASSANDRSSRAVRGGMEYIRRLRALDGLETEDGVNNANTPPRRFEDPPSPVRPSQVFPWYSPTVDDDLAQQMSSLQIASNMDEDEHDPNGTSSDWYQMARARMAAMNATPSGSNPYDDPNGEMVEDVGEAPLRVRRRVVTGANAGVTQRQRNRSARVIADEESNFTASSDTLQNSQNVEAGGELWNVVDGWTVIDPRPTSPVRRTRDEGSENVTTWFRGPSFSASPGLIDHATQNAETTQSRPNPFDPRITRPLTRDVSLSSDDLARMLEEVRGANGQRRRPSVEVETEGQDNRQASSTPSAPVRRAEFASGRSEEPQRRTAYRESTPSPEPQRQSAEDIRSNGLARNQRLSSIGARLGEEFRSRQSELREREQRLRTEVARRRMELDQLRQQQGRIGRVVERSRRDRDNDQPGAAGLSSPSQQDTSDTQTVIATPMPQATSGSSLVRRRTVRDAAPNLRTFRRSENRRLSSSNVFNESVNRQLTLNTLQVIRSLQQVQNQSGFNYRRRRTRSHSSLLRAPLPNQDRLSFDDNVIVQSRSLETVLATTPSVSLDDADTIGTAGLALIALVDALATPFSIGRAARFAGMAENIITQRTLPSTFEDTSFPLRFALIGSHHNKDESSKEAGNEPSSSSNSNRLSNVMSNDESTCSVEASGLHINLKFLAATNGMAHQLRMAEQSKDARQEADEVDHESFARAIVSRGNQSHSLGREEQELVYRCLKEAKKDLNVDFMTPEELFINGGETVKELLEKRKITLYRSALLGSPKATKSTNLTASIPTPTFCLSRLIIKIPHRHTLFASMNATQGWPNSFSSLAERPRWIALIFVSWTPISTTDLNEYDGYSEEDVRRLARRYGVRGPGLSPGNEYNWRSSKAVSVPFENDETLGDPFAIEKADEKGKQKEGQSSGQSTKPALLPVGMQHLQFSQTMFDFTQFVSGANKELGSVQGISGRYLAVKVMLSSRLRQRTLIDEQPPETPKLEIQWIGAHGHAGARSFGGASWRD